MKSYIFLFVISQYLMGVYGQELVVTIDQGPVRGYRHATRDIYEFYGIPYATAPTGADKFKAPLPAPSWEDVFEATDDFVACPQDGGIPYREDCLILNVFLPGNITTPKPVLAMIHGGGFFAGFGNMASPYNLVERDVIVVTLNYRLGAHGFLCLNTETVPGNSGMRDQIAALKWVKNNIEAFGGNPENITILGNSAGAGSAELLLLSPAADNLFNKVILESASTIGTWVVNRNGFEFARTVAINNGASNIDNATQLEDFYLALTYDELLALTATDIIKTSFTPCVEHDNGEVETVINILPHIILQSGNYTKVPLLTGWTDAEGLLFYDDREITMREMNENFADHLPDYFDTQAVMDLNEATELIKSFYFDEDIITEDSIRNFTDYLTDSMFSYWIIESAKQHARNSAPVYLYEYTYVASTQTKAPYLGAEHIAQTYLILEMQGPLNETDLIVQRQLVDIWTNFIKFGEIPLSETEYWEPLEAERMNYLAIDVNLESKNFPMPERMQLWDQIVKGREDPHSVLLVTIDQGTVRGHKHANRDIYEFHGIPYATVPTGEDRFKAPLPAPSWGGILDATEDFIACPQSGGIPYIEECLVVNVFLPGNNTTPKPVIVIIHGAGFFRGSGNMVMPYNLVEKDVIAVSFNYRLGALGFLCLNTETVPGNSGMRDQIAALKWVKNNIEAFGGNSEDITILGFGASAGSAETLMLSPAADNLFNKVILESSSAMGTWAVNPESLEFARNVAIRNGASDVDDVTQLEDYYLALSLEELLNLELNEFSRLGFLPCIENDNGNEEIIIKTLPRNTLQSGNYTKLPVLIGWTDAEGLQFYEDRETIMAQMNENFSDHLPINFVSYAHVSEQEAVELLKAFYFDEDVINEDSIRNYTDYLGDGLYTYGIIESAKLHALNSAPVYLYEFTYVPSTQINGRDLGAEHCAQTFLILEDSTQNVTLSETDRIVLGRLVDMWTNFIKFGEPVPLSQSEYWEPLDHDRMNYVTINLNMQNRTSPLPDRMQLWDQIMKESEDLDTELFVTIDQGTVRGHKHATRDIYEFHGIPYATVPTGEDRFKAPLPAPTWTGIFDATEDFILCPQDLAGLPYREDCLVVNIFLPGNNLTSKSVLVIIHGGGFSIGFGNMGLPYNVVERDFIVVTLNYRLGAHGFLCLNTDTAPGNAGLKDQIAALKWVKSNIEAFGGNSEDITILGYSAGAASAELLMLSPATNNLFNKVILESGTALSTWAVNPKGLELARNVAIENGASNVDDDTQLEEYYLALSFEELLKLAPNDGTTLTFTPCIENDNGDDEIVIKTLPYNILQSGNYSKLPLLTGWTDAEGLLYYEDRERIMAEMNENFNNHLPPNFVSYAHVTEEEAIELIKPFYFDEDIITENSVRNYTDYFTDHLFAYWIIESAKLQSINSTSVYLYEFTYVPSTQVSGQHLGAGHCAHTFLILDESLSNMPLSENDRIVQRRLVDMWTNFIKFGEPVPISQSEYWEPLDGDKMNYLDIGLNVQNRTFPLPERIRLWDQIMKEEEDSGATNSLYLYMSLLFLSIILVIR